MLEVVAPTRRDDTDFSTRINKKAEAARLGIDVKLSVRPKSDDFGGSLRRLDSKRSVADESGFLTSRHFDSNNLIRYFIRKCVGQQIPPLDVPTRMWFNSVSRQVRCVFATQVLFIIDLVATGSLVIAASALELYNILWSCPVLNIYYAVSWLSLVLGSLKLLLGLSGALFLAIQPSCVDPKLSTVVLVGPKGNLGQIDAPHYQHRLRSTSTPVHPSTQLWTLRLNQSRHSSSAATGDGLCSVCRRGCCSSLGWLRPCGLLLALIIVGELVAVFLTAGFETRALNPISGIHSQMQSMFVEAKADLLTSRRTLEPATDCWETLERDFQCCGATGYKDWLVEPSPTQPTTDSIANLTASTPSAEHHPDAVISFLLSRCSCFSNPSSFREGNCFNVTLMIEPNNTKFTLPLFSRSCSQVITDIVLRGLTVLKIALVVSLCLTICSFIISLCVTLKVASQGSSESEVVTMSRIGHNPANRPTATEEIPQATTLPPKFSSVAMPAIRAFSLHRTTKPIH
nr:unnamed protein product [Spirometra erinaceieuropaei]